jgi:hypothetical protein
MSADKCESDINEQSSVLRLEAKYETDKKSNKIDNYISKLDNSSRNKGKKNSNTNSIIKNDSELKSSENSVIIRKKKKKQKCKIVESDIINNLKEEILSQLKKELQATTSRQSLTNTLAKSKKTRK